MKLNHNYLEKVYSGILGKLIGVYLGRPFEGWTYKKIIRELGHVKYYVNDKFNLPVVVTDDDISGTFTFIRALEDFNFKQNISSKQIGDTWLNYIIENHTILWWGGNGISTEHTALLNLRNGISAPESGSIKRNGKTIAEQIGAQIFIDCWGLVSPGNPKLASQLAKKASKVSHDGEAVYAAQLWAAMEAEAFNKNDVGHLINTGLSLIPRNCEISKVVNQIVNWYGKNKDWENVRELINYNFGYDKFKGNCHIIPNHAIMIMSLLFSNYSFHKAQSIVNTSGWDTDCNAGNIGCLLGIMLGLDGLNSGPDWRGPIADRMILSSADGGNSINNAVKMSYYIANIGKRLNGEIPFPSPKNNSKFHFSLPGSVQGFKISDSKDKKCTRSIRNIKFKNKHLLEVKFSNLNKNESIYISTPTFIDKDIYKMRTYNLMLTPLIYPGQILKTRILLDTKKYKNLFACLSIKFHSKNNKQKRIDSEKFELIPDKFKNFTWKIPDHLSMPIAEVGLLIGSRINKSKGRVLIDYMTWSNRPEFNLYRPDFENDYWQRSWVKNVDNFSLDLANIFAISQNYGLGLVAHGNNDWSDYKIDTLINMHYGKNAGIIFRYKGLKRYYALEICYFSRIIRLVKYYDRKTFILKSFNFKFEYDENIPVSILLKGSKFSFKAKNLSFSFIDNSKLFLNNGGYGFSIFEGSLSINKISIK